MKQWCLKLATDAYRILKVVALVAVPAALLLTHVWYQYQMTRLGYEISKETKRHEKLADQHRKLTIQTTVESRSERIAEVAKRRFGLERVEPDQIITVDPDAHPTDDSLDETEHASLERPSAD